MATINKNQSKNIARFWQDLGVQPSLFNTDITTQNIMWDNMGLYLFSIVKGNAPSTRYYATGRNKTIMEAELSLPPRLTFEALCEKVGIGIQSKNPFDGEFEYVLEGIKGVFYTSNEPGSDVGFYQEKR